MAIYEKTLIDPDRILQHDQLVVDGVDVSGSWNTMITPRTLTDYEEHFGEIIQSYSGGENVHRCWQCGSCTNSCTMYAQNVDFNPRYWIYLINLGLKAELMKDKDIIWQCVSCNKCNNICPKDVRPEGVMKATAHWLEDNGLTPKTNSTMFDEEFTHQCIEFGRIEDTEVMMGFFKRSGQPLVQAWIVEFGQRLMKNLPLGQLAKMGMNTVFRPKTKGWGKTGEVLMEYVKAQKEAAHHG